MVYVHPSPDGVASSLPPRVVREVTAEALTRPVLTLVCPEPRVLAEVPTSPADVVESYARQADELAAMVEVEITREVARHGDALQRLRVLAAACGEQHVQLDELSHRLRRGAG